MVSKYIHIGYPKNLSTSLQRDFFGKHNELMHLGIGCNDHNLGYVSDDVSLALEFYLRYAKDFIYKAKEAEIKSLFEQYFLNAEQNKSIKAVGISGEHIGFNFTPDNIDVAQKAHRLYNIFGSDTKIIMIIRKQTDLIKSLYNECIRVGYPDSYCKYIEYVYMFHERNFASDFLYGHTYELYENLFGGENICVIPMETIRKDNKLVKAKDDKVLVLKILSDHLGISYPLQELGHYNEALSQSALVKKNELNAQYRHDLGNSLFGTAESHRVSFRYCKDLMVEPPYEVKNDVLKKRKSIEKAIQLSEKNPNLKVNYDCNPTTWTRLEEFFKESNLKLQKKLSIDLKSLGYPL